MKIILTGLAGLICICLISQVASGFEPKIPLSNTSLAVLSDCDSGYLVKNCNSQKTIKQTKGYAVNLKESLSMDSDKKKDTKAKEKKSDTKKPKAKDLKKKFEKVKEKLKVKKKPTTSKQSSAQKTKHDTAKNSIGNIR